MQRDVKRKGLLPGGALKAKKTRRTATILRIFLLLCLLAGSICSFPGEQRLVSAAPAPAPATPLSVTVQVPKAPDDTEGKLYKVADFDAESGAFTLVPAFADVPGLKNLLDNPPKVLDSEEIKAKYKKDLQDKGQTLLSLITQNNITPSNSAKTKKNAGGDGELSFPEQGKTLDPALYLLVIDPYISGKMAYTPQINMFTIPAKDPQNATQWLRQLKITAKVEEKPNTEEITVIKLWEDECGKVLNTMEQLNDKEKNKISVKYPDKITAILYQDGKEYKRAELSAANNWQYVFKDLPVGHRYVVGEVKNSAYKLLVTVEGKKVVLHNRLKPGTPPCPPPTSPPGTPPGTPPAPPEKLPFTAVLWWPVYLCGAAGLALICLGLLRRKHRER